MRGQVLPIEDSVPISLDLDKLEKVMAFNLKNVGATYGCLANEMFNDLTRKTMEVYFDDMLVKSLNKADHLEHLRA